MIAKFKPVKKARFAREARRGSWQNIFFFILLGSLILTVIGFLVVSNFRINQRRAELSSRIEGLKKEIQALEEKREALQARVSQSGEEGYLEKEARESFNLKKPGEEVVKILPLEEKKEKSGEEKQWWNPFSW